jgi:hypothetical protein
VPISGWTMVWRWRWLKGAGGAVDHGARSSCARSGGSRVASRRDPGQVPRLVGAWFACLAHRGGSCGASPAWRGGGGLYYPEAGK